MQKHKVITEDDIFSLLKKNEEDLILSEKTRKFRDENCNPYPNGWKRQDFYREIFSDMRVDGILMKYPHGSIIRQAERSFYYRGENQIFKSSQATLYRKLNKFEDKAKALVEEFVAYMRIADFLWLLLKFDHTQMFLSLELSLNNRPITIDLLYEQIAQHYGLDTVWLDITSDFEVALFFSCCKFNYTTKKWEPLTREDFNINHETKFGVIFRIPTNHPNNFLPYNNKSIDILPVGFQPFMRCHMQHSYVAKTGKSYCLQNDRTFEILRFRHSEKICNYIYEKMEGGKKIYPQEGLLLMSDEIEDIIKRKNFSNATFDYAFEEPMFKFHNKGLFKESLAKYGYEIINASNYVPKEKIEIINNQYADFDIEKTFDIKLRTRLCVIPQTDKNTDTRQRQ